MSGNMQRREHVWDNSGYQRCLCRYQDLVTRYRCHQLLVQHSTVCYYMVHSRPQHCTIQYSRLYNPLHCTRQTKQHNSGKYRCHQPLVQHNTIYILLGALQHSSIQYRRLYIPSQHDKHNNTIEENTVQHISAQHNSTTQQTITHSS